MTTTVPSKTDFEKILDRLAVLEETVKVLQGEPPSDQTTIDGGTPKGTSS